MVAYRNRTIRPKPDDAAPMDSPSCTLGYPLWRIGKEPASFFNSDKPRPNRTSDDPSPVSCADVLSSRPSQPAFNTAQDRSAWLSRAGPTTLPGPGRLPPPGTSCEASSITRYTTDRPRHRSLWEAPLGTLSHLPTARLASWSTFHRPATNRMSPDSFCSATQPTDTSASQETHDGFGVPTEADSSTDKQRRPEPSPARRPESRRNKCFRAPIRTRPNTPRHRSIFQTDGSGDLRLHQSRPQPNEPCEEFSWW